MNQRILALLITGITMAGCASHRAAGPAAARSPTISSEDHRACVMQAVRNQTDSGNSIQDFNPTRGSDEAATQMQICLLQRGNKPAG